MSLAALLVAWLLAPLPAHAVDAHFGPLVGFEAYSRRSPEPTDSIRFTFGLTAQVKYSEHWPQFDFAALTASGVDEFASQNSIDERLYRFRFGFIVEPFNFDTPTVGLRFGGQYGIGKADYNIRFPLSTDKQDPSYLSPYVGFVVGITPIAGFGVRDEFTATYDTFLDCWIYQIAFGIPLQ